MKKLILDSLAVCFVVGMLGVSQATAGLVGHWSMDEIVYDEVTGNYIVEDKSSNANDGIVYGGAVADEGKSGSAVYFDGVDDYVEVAADESLILGSNGTVECWVRLPYVGNYPPSGTHSIVSGGIGYADSILLNQDFHVFKAYWTGYGPSVSAVWVERLRPSDTWTYLAVTNDNGSVTIYIDGVLKATGTQGGNVYKLRPVCIGGIPYGAGSIWNVTGTIDEVRMYDNALTGDDIATHYDAYLDPVAAEVAAIADAPAPLSFEISPQSLNVKSGGEEFTAAKLIAATDVPADVTVNLSFYEGAVGIGSYEIRVDDEVVDSGMGSPPASIELVDIFGGSHTVTLTVTDSLGLVTDSDSESFSVNSISSLEDLLNGIYTLTVEGVPIPAVAVDPQVVLVADRQAVISAVEHLTGSGAVEVSVELSGEDSAGIPIAGADSMRVFDPATDRGASGKPKKD